MKTVMRRIISLWVFAIDFFFLQSMEYRVGRIDLYALIIAAALCYLGVAAWRGSFSFRGAVQKP